MAASLGGITSNKVGADNIAVASCDTDGVTTAYATSWDTTDKRYVSLTDSTGAQIGSGSLAIPTSAAVSHSVSLSAAASAKLTEGVHVLISS